MDFLQVNRKQTIGSAVSPLLDAGMLIREGGGVTLFVEIFSLEHRWRREGVSSQNAFSDLGQGRSSYPARGALKPGTPRSGGRYYLVDLESKLGRGESDFVAVKLSLLWL